MSAWRTWSRSEVVCRLLVAILPSVALLVAPVRPGTATVVVVAAGSVLWASAPELSAGPLVLLWVMGWWALVVPDPVQLRILVAAGALLSAHVAALLASYGPARAEIDARLVRTWSGRALLALVPALLVLVAVAALDGAPEQPLMWPLALGALVLLTLVVGLQLREQQPVTSPQARSRSVDDTRS